MSQIQDLAFRAQLLEEQVEELKRQLRELALRAPSVGVGSYTLVSRPPSAGGVYRRQVCLLGG